VCRRPRQMVKCWDLEANKVIRHYHGHLSGVYSLALHPTLDVLITAGRDASARVWDMRTKAQVHVLAGHTGTVGVVRAQASDPQVITGSMDSTVRLWDLAAGRTLATLTHHKKSVRALDIHPTEFSFVSGSAGGNNIKKWKCPEGTFVCNFSGHDAIINTMSVNAEGVLFSGGACPCWLTRSCLTAYACSRQRLDHVLGLRHRHAVPEPRGHPAAGLARGRGGRLLLDVRPDRHPAHHRRRGQDHQGPFPPVHTACLC
jgi:hypothetical protein